MTKPLDRSPLKLLVGLALSAILACSLTDRAAAHDWPHWRGPEQNGVAREKGLPERWSPDPAAANNNLIWKMPHGSRSTPLVMKGRVFIINYSGDEPSHNEQERVMAFDAATGKVLWEYKFNVWQTDVVTVRLGWTNLDGDPETGNIYAHGSQGLLLCLNRDGKLLWSRSLTEEYGRVSGYGGRLTSPTVDGDLVIIGMADSNWGQFATGGNRFMAFDKRNGSVVWETRSLGKPRTYFSNPVVAVINGERLLITGTSDGAVAALRVRTGELVWSYTFGAGAINVSPVVEGTRVYIAHGEESPDTNVQGRVICVDAGKVKDGKPELVWKVDEIKAKYASPIIHDGRLYICDETAQMYCLDAKNGEELWTFRYGRDCKGSPVWADGKIYVGEVNARFHILQPGTDACKDLYVQRFRSPDGSSEVEINGSAAVANGRVYFSTSFETYCIGKKDAKTEADKIPPEPKEAALATDAKPAHLQIVPAEVALEPGASASFKVRAFDAHGRFVREEKAEWSLAASPPPEGLPPPRPGAAPAPPAPALKGTITADGKLTVDKMLPGQMGVVVAKAGSLTSQARVRVVPTLPYKQDFEKVPEGRTPAGWVNCQGKFAVRQMGDSKVLVKLGNNPNPALARANAYIGLPNLADYTIACDVQATRLRDNMPDLGVVGQRYTLMLTGTQQSLRIVSWEALPRIDKTVAFAWKPEVWYRMKLMVENQGDKAVAHGKVWKRDEPEPKDWTIEITDLTPNREGSPALYGYCTGSEGGGAGTEVYYDNLTIAPNKQIESKAQPRQEAKPKTDNKPAAQEEAPPQPAEAPVLLPAYPVEFQQCGSVRRGLFRRGR